MRIASGGRTLPGVPGSLTRRQLLIRTGGATVALTCFGALPGGAVADPAALNAARAGTYGAILAAIDADPAYSIAARDALVAGFAERYAADEALRSYADAVLDAIGPRFANLTPAAAREHLAGWDGRLKPDALTLASLAFEAPEDSHTIVFTV